MKAAGLFRRAAALLLAAAALFATVGCNEEYYDWKAAEERRGGADWRTGPRIIE